MSATYSFLDVQGSITGPGIAAQLGNGAGVAKEGISVEMLEEKDLMTIGADGEIMHSLRGSNAGRITVRLLKTSPTNAVLSQAYNFQKSSSANWGKNVMRFSNTVVGDVITADTIAFAKQTGITYAEDASMNEWTFYGRVNMLLGSGVPNVNI